MFKSLIFFLFFSFSAIKFFGQHIVMHKKAYTVLKTDINQLAYLNKGSVTVLKLSQNDSITLNINMNVANDYNLRSIGAIINCNDDGIFNLAFYNKNGKLIYEGLIYFKKSKMGFIICNDENDNASIKLVENQNLIIDN